MSRAVRIPRAGSWVLSRRMIQASTIVAGAAALASIADMATGIPFSRMWTLNIPFLLTSAIIFYLAYDAWTDLAPRCAVGWQAEVERVGGDDYVYRNTPRTRSRRHEHGRRSRSGRTRVSRA